jgi:heavy metal sensor kinase
MIAWWQRRTLRFRLALWYAAGGVLLLAAFSATLYLFVAQRMARPLDHQLRRQLGEITARLAVAPGGQITWDGQPIPADVHWTPNNRWFELWDEDNRLVRRFWPFDEANLEFLPRIPAREREFISVFYIARDIRLRSLSTPYVMPGRPNSWTIRVMTIHEPVADALEDLRLIILIALPVVIALLVFGGYLITRRWLRPLDRLVAAAGNIKADDLSRRLPIGNPHDELGRLAQVFNVTLDRLERSFAGLDRFVADASHELRTPLTTLRSVGEVGLKRVRSPEEYCEIIASMLEEAQRLQRLTERLLELAKAEAGAQVLHLESVDLTALLRQVAGELMILAEQRDQPLLIEATAAARLRTDPVLLRQVLQNLLDNAIKYSPAGSSIRVALLDTGATWTFAITDGGPGIPPEQRALLTERFYRIDRSRSLVPGFGLGLALTKAYARDLGGELTCTAAPLPARGSTFSLVLPKQ